MCSTPFHVHTAMLAHVLTSFLMQMHACLILYPSIYLPTYLSTYLSWWLSLSLSLTLSLSLPPPLSLLSLLPSLPHFLPPSLPPSLPPCCSAGLCVCDAEQLPRSSSPSWGLALHENSAAETRLQHESIRGMHKTIGQSTDGRLNMAWQASM